jgi:hypothetical protein
MGHVEETTLQMARKRVDDGRAIIAEPKTLIAELRAAGRPTEAQEAILVGFEISRRIFEERLALVEGFPEFRRKSPGLSDRG